MASIIIFATLWGLASKEWLGTSPRTNSIGQRLAADWIDKGIRGG